MTLFPTVLILWNSWVHIGITNGSNEAHYIKPSVNKAFSLGPTLYIPYVDPNNGHVQLRRNFDDLRFGD